MAKRGLVTRKPSPDDWRGAFVVISPAGRAAIETAAPHHVAMVRRLIVDPLTPDDLATLARISDHLLDSMQGEP